MPAIEVINPDGSISIHVDEHTTLGPFATLREAMKAILPLIMENNRKIDEELQRLITMELGRRPPEGA